MSTLQAGTYTGAATKIASAILSGYSTPTATGVDIHSTLFSNGQQGVWFDPSDMSTLFQDSAGTTPVTGVGQPVGKILDKSGNAHHAIQATSTARPTYGRHPLTGVRNLLIGTDTLATQSYTTLAVAYTLSFTGTGTVTLSGAYVGSLVGTGASNRVSLTFTSTAASLTLTVSGLVTFAQLELGSAVTNYQSVVSQFDITEVGVNYAYYLYGDGVDNTMVTPSIDLTGTQKASCFVGIRKLNDASIQIVVEHGVAGTDALAASFLSAPRGTANYGIDIRDGTKVSTASSAPSYAAPITNIVTTTADYTQSTIATQVVTMVNGSSVGNVELGTGPVSSATFFGKYPLYILARGGPQLPFTGNLYGLIVRGAASSAFEIAAAEQWMNSKTGAY